LSHLAPGEDEERIDEIRRRQIGFADEGSKGFCTAETSRALRGESHQAPRSIIVAPVEEVGGAELAAEHATAADVLMFVTDHLVTDGTLVEVGIIFVDGARLALLHAESLLRSLGAIIGHRMT
jgi:hypothetical protein